MEINVCIQNCHPGERPPLDFILATFTVTGVEVLIAALLKEKSGKKPSYVLRRPLKLVLCIHLRESVGFRGKYHVQTEKHIGTSLVQE